MAPPASADETHTHAIEIVRTLRETGAKLVCIDFDATFVSIHTGGAWSETAAELRPFVRALFLALVPLLCDAAIHVAVVTFSPQDALIRQVLALCFETDVVQSLIVRCDDASWTLEKSEPIEFVPAWQLSGMHFDRKYKLPYVISAAKQASRERGELICNRDTILIDDDAKNIRIAIDNGITGIYFEPEGAEPRELCRRILKLHAPLDAATTAVQAGNPANLPMHTPLKRKNVRLLQTPEPSPRPLNRAPPSVRLQQTPVLASMPRSKKFSLCTPSPVMKLKCTVDMGRPKKAARSRHCPRNIEDDLHDLHIPVAPASAPRSLARRSPPPPLPFLSSSPRSPDGRFSSIPFVEAASVERDM